MGCSRPSPRNSGYATPAALVFALAIALIAAALVGRSVAALRLARADMARTEVEYGLDGAHFAAAATIVRSLDEGPFDWSLSTDVGWVEVLAEPEAGKLGLKAASQLPDGVVAVFGVADPASLKAKMAQMDEQDLATEIAELDPAPLWRACAPRMISAFGKAKAFAYVAPSEPRAERELPNWRVGEVWRVRGTTATGWRDDRIVRFTGDARHPAATVTRRMVRSRVGEGTCAEILSAAG